MPNRIICKWLILHAIAYVMRFAYSSPSCFCSLQNPSSLSCCLVQGMERIPCVVIGAGAVGLAIGRALSGAGVSTLVLESQSTFGTGNSSRNSEVLHAGLYYPPGSLKESMCNGGKEKLRTYMKEKSVPFSQCGKVVIASTSSEVPTLHKIFKNGQQSGINDLKLLTAAEVHSLEPSLSCVAGMLSPFTSIFDSHQLMLSYIVDLEESGSEVIYNCAVQNVTKSISNSAHRGGFEVTTSQGTVLCDFLVNSAGLYAPFVASHMDFYPPSAVPRTYYAKGSYFKLQGVAAKDVPFRRLVYPIPQAGGLGVHATLDMEGNVKFGPNVEWVPYRNVDVETASMPTAGDRYLFPPGVPPPSDFQVSLTTPTGQVSADGAEVTEPTVDVFFKEISKYWPGVRRDMLVPDYAGIRPKLCGPTGSAPPSPGAAPSSSIPSPASPFPLPEPANSSGGGAYAMPASADFAILGRAAHGVPGLVCLFGIESPGLTSSLAIADHVRNLLLGDK